MKWLVNALGFSHFCCTQVRHRHSPDISLLS